MNRRGFSLLEVLIVISIIAVLAGVIVFAATRATDSARLARTLTEARSRASDTACDAYFSCEKGATNTETLMYDGPGDVNADAFNTMREEVTSATLRNGTAWDTGRWQGKRALRFDGSDDQVILTGGISEMTCPFTLVAWIKDEDSDGGGIISASADFLEPDGSRFWTGVYICVTDDARIVGGYGNNPGSTANGNVWHRFKKSDATYTKGEWVMLAVVVRGNNDISVYINGKDAGGTYDGNRSAVSGIRGKNIDLYLGFANFGGGSKNYFTGLIDEAYYIRRNLTDGDIAAIYSSGKP